MGLNRIEKLAEYKSVIFIDFFDTVMFRQIHSHQLIGQWENALKRKYTQLIKVDLCKLRRIVINEIGKDECAISYDVLLERLYLKLISEIDFSVTFKEFKKISYKIDYSLDMATQYPNRAIVKILKRLKSSGKKIYIVTDYYLPGKCYENYLRPYRLQNLYDGIFCSSDYQKTKIDGDLYDEVLSSLGVAADEVLMIGDSKKSDFENAIKTGITAYRYFPFLHKIKTNIRKKLKYSYSRHISKAVFNNCYRNTLFGEYALNLYYFSKKLHQEINSLNMKDVYFLARGGYFLKKCFDGYNELQPIDQNIDSVYLKNSRKVNRLATQNDIDRELLNKYLIEHVKNDEICVVDEGWYCTSQIIIEKLSGIRIHGFYIGIMGRNSEDCKYDRKGILFDIDENGVRSPLFGVFRTNCTFYEQLLSAPHGSTKKYCDHGDTVDVLEEWKEIEKYNYYKNIEPMQNIIADFCLGLQSWDTNISLYELAKFVMKTLLFGSNERLNLLKQVNDAWYDNANDTREKNFGKISNIRISFLELIVRPENYLRYFCKIKDLTLKHRVMKVIYFILGPLIYIYCRLGILKYKGTLEC